MAKSLYSARSQRLCRLLVEARKAAGLTQHQVAKRMRVDQSVISKYETGQRQLDVVQFVAVAEALRTDAADLIRKLQSD